MPLELPTYSEIIARSRSDLKRALPNLDPTIFESLVAGIVESVNGRHFDNVKSIEQLVKELFPDTAELTNLQRWSIYDGITPFTAEQSEGYVVIPGIVGTIIPLNRVFNDVNGNAYINQAIATITAQSISILSITRSGSTVTVKTSSGHNFATNLEVTISGAVETDYNGVFPITVTDTDEFTYEITETPTTPATGTLLASCDCVKIRVNSENTGSDKNLESGADMSFVTILPGADDGFVSFLGLTGGRNIESKESLLNRTKQQRANPVANFNVGAIEKKVLEVSGVTRVKVKRITPDIGQVTVLFVRDGDDNIIPTAAEVAEVKSSILEILPVTSEESDVIVTAPTPVPTDYVFLSITPDTPTMQAAIQQQLIAFYEDVSTFETTITEDKYRSAISDTIDPDTGDKLTSFTLSSPSGNISVGTDSIGTLGTVSF